MNKDRYNQIMSKAVAFNTLSERERYEFIAMRDNAKLYAISCMVGKRVLTGFTAAKTDADAYRSATCRWLRSFNSPAYYNYSVREVVCNG